MFKFETPVVAVIFAVLFMSAGAFAADPDAANRNGDAACAELTRALLDSTKRAEAVAAAKLIYPDKSDAEALNAYRQDTCRNHSQSGTAGCSNAEHDFNAAKLEHIDNCFAHPQGGDGGNIGCGHAIEHCLCAKMPESNWSNRKACRDLSPEEGSSRASSGGIDFRGLSKKYSVCPAMAAQGLDKLEAEAREQRKAVSEAQKKLQEAQKGAGQADKGAGDKLSQIREQMAAEQEKAADKMKEAKRQQEDSRNQLQQQLNQYTDEVNKIEERRNQLRMSRHQSDLTYREALMKIRLGCHNQALGQTNELQKIHAAELQMKVLNRGGFGNMMKNVGMTERQRWQQKASEFYKRCMNSTPTRDTQKAALEVREAALTDLDKQEQKVDADRALTEKKMRQIRNGTTCSNNDTTQNNGDTSETAMCQARRRAIEDARHAAALMQNKMAMLRGNAAQAMADARKSQGQEMSGVQNATGDLAREQGRLADLEALLDLKKSKANGQSMDDKQFSDSLSKYSKMKAAASKLIDCQAPARGRRASGGDCGAECQQAGEYLFSIGAIGSDRISAIREAGGPAGTPEPGDRRPPPSETEPRTMEE